MRISVPYTTPMRMRVALQTVKRRTNLLGGGSEAGAIEIENDLAKRVGMCGNELRLLKVVELHMHRAWLQAETCQHAVV
jgi:hypothetical protein